MCVCVFFVFEGGSRVVWEQLCAWVWPFYCPSMAIHNWDGGGYCEEVEGRGGDSGGCIRSPRQHAGPVQGERHAQGWQHHSYL